MDLAGALAQVEQIPGVAGAIDRYGIAAVLACLMLGGGFMTWRIYLLFADPDKGLLVTGHRQMMESIAMNSRANESNARANEANARANEVHAEAHQRTARKLGVIIEQLKLKDEDREAGS